MIRTTLATVAVLALAAPALAQTPPPAPATPAKTALEKYPAKGGARLTVTTPALKDGGDIPWANTQWKTNTFPGLAWKGAPKGVKSYAVIMQDADIVIRGGPVLHWTMFNIPGSVTKLEAGMTTPPEGAGYGPNYKGAAQPYQGPKTPPNRKDHYHFEVFALDTTAPPEAGASFDALTAAIDGHVLASGEVVGLAQAYPPTLPTTLKDE